MITVLAYWLLLFFIFLPGGLLLNNILKLRTANITLLILTGMFFYTVIFTVAAFLMPLSAIVFYSAAGVSILTLVIYRKDAAGVLRAAASQFRSLPASYKIIFTLLAAGAALKSAQLPGITDNETYYVQTIKWLNEYGIVKGLGNLHVFLSQTSSWHVLQAGLNFSFITDRLNDINGFLFVVCLFLYFNEGKTERKTVSLTATIPLFSAVFFYFIDAPSPDLPLLVVFPIIIHLLLKRHIVLAWILFLFLAFIKITIAPLGLLFLYPLFRERTQLLFMAASGFFVLVLWILKNIVISGYPIYPFTSFGTGAEWQVPGQLLEGLHATSNIYVYGTADDTTAAGKFWSWLCRSGIDGLFNKLMIILLATVPCLAIFRKDKRYRAIYGVVLLQFIIVYVMSAQFRFFLPGMLFLSACLAAAVINGFKKIPVYNTALAIMIVACAYSFSEIKGRSLLLPEKNHRNICRYSLQSMGNLNYFSPDTAPLMYYTGNGPLPCVNKRQVLYFHRKYNIRPQMAGKSINEGFRSVKTN
ncbi:hypothetical protein CHU92_07505 [Flavobacterium cyanobacteriorum]|uniref:DUF8201 domain-containing protein n=1 Tax=Flavobacterium cyanobacteriorum TaxID=2022802 RepID=A0A255ZB45_9FLAO|nr:hypothetical protein [Flavobacterium cyanobacteriorum]OYQ37830.1 hypothetical protein CHU92_07505 [Flavobacterium cyanobacteriorum]